MIECVMWYLELFLDNLSGKHVCELGGPVVKSVTSCAGGPGFRFQGGEPKIFKWPSSAKSQ